MDAAPLRRADRRHRRAACGCCGCCGRRAGSRRGSGGICRRRARRRWILPRRHDASRPDDEGKRDGTLRRHRHHGQRPRTLRRRQSPSGAGGWTQGGERSGGAREEDLRFRQRRRDDRANRGRPDGGARAAVAARLDGAQRQREVRNRFPAEERGTGFRQRRHPGAQPGVLRAVDGRPRGSWTADQPQRRRDESR